MLLVWTVHRKSDTAETSASSQPKQQRHCADREARDVESTTRAEFVVQLH